MLIEIFIFVIGLVVGSFLNVCIQRLPREESIVKPGSRCPECKHGIAWHDNVPLLSFLLLGGRCRHCHTRISFRYPLIELISGGIWLWSWQADGNPALFLIRTVFVSILLVTTVTDLETGLIPDEFNLFGTAVGLAGSVIYPALHETSLVQAALLRSVIGLLVGGGLIYITGMIGDWIFQRESMGGGDIKFLAMAGTFLGWEKVLLTFMTAPFLALPFALYLRWFKKEDVIPYGPFLSMAAGVHFLYGNWFWKNFLTL